MSARGELKKLANKKTAEHSQRFFKTGEGEYGYGDQFLGVRVPDIRKIAKNHTSIKTTELNSLIQSKWHEERLLGLIILVNQYKRAKEDWEKEALYKYYVSKFKYINNWDLVDVTCPHVVGAHLMGRDRKVLYKWAQSKHLWTKRIAIVSNWWLIRKGDVSEIYNISELLVNDDHDLVHKAVGWMLREAAKKDMQKTETFLKKHGANMPRTMLRYAIERFPEKKRKSYLNMGK